MIAALMLSVLGMTCEPEELPKLDYTDMGKIFVACVEGETDINTMVTTRQVGVPFVEIIGYPWNPYTMEYLEYLKSHSLIQDD